MTYEEIRHAWNAQAEDFNQWAELGLIKKVEYAARLGAEKERAARQKAQEEVVFLKERIARAGVEQRRAVREAVLEEREACAQVCAGVEQWRALYEALQQEREACAKVCDEVGDKMGGSVGAYDCAAAIRARNQ